MSTVGFRPDSIHGGTLTQDASDRLHFMKNRPDPWTVNGAPLEFAPYRYEEFPRAMYHEKDETSPRLVENEQTMRNLLSRGWALKPDEAKDAYAAWHDKAVAFPAAERAFDDRHMSPKAKAEVAALEAVATDHVVDPVIEPVREKRKYTRKAKQEA